MASINFLQLNNNPQIYIRFVNGRKFDLKTRTNIVIDSKFWDKKNQKIRNVIDVPNRDSVNGKLTKLKIFLNDKFNEDYTNGEIINKQWLDNSISVFFGRPSGENENKPTKHLIYYTDFADWWLENKADKHKVSASKLMDETTQRHYKILNNIVKDFQGKDKLKLKEITPEKIDSFSLYLTDTKGYSYKTANRMIGRFRFFCSQAEMENLEVNKNYKKTVFVKKEEQEIKEPYLNEEEITAIFNHKFEDEILDSVRDNFIIGLWTGLRVSDFLNSLKIDNIKDDFIEIKTTKTGTLVAIPLHDQVKHILNKRNGQLPPKISDQKFNKHIKTICEDVKINSEMLGAVVEVDEKTKVKRKKIDIYKKYQLISSHICRRSFCTNLFGKVPNSVIMAVAGWTSEKQMLSYVKLTHFEKAKELKEYWEKNKI